MTIFIIIMIGISAIVVVLRREVGIRTRTLRTYTFRRRIFTRPCKLARDLHRVLHVN